jgi:hypothetical protein
MAASKRVISPARAATGRRLGREAEQEPNTEELLGYSSFAWLTSTPSHTTPASTINDQLTSAYTHKDELENFGGFLAFQTIKLGSCGPLEGE